MPDKDEYDPVFLHARREALVIVALFSAFCLWSIYVCYNYGFMGPDDQQATVKIILGMPSWVFWGLFLPWIAVDAVAVWFCFFFMKADDLGEAHEGEETEHQVRMPGAGPAVGEKRFANHGATPPDGWEGKAPGRDRPGAEIRLAQRFLPSNRPSVSVGSTMTS